MRAALLMAVLLSGGCGDDDVFTASGQANNVVMAAGVVYASVGGDGFVVIDPSTGGTLAEVAPMAPAESVDDLAIDGSYLFALDAREPAHVTVYDIRTPSSPSVVSGPVAVDVAEFSGIAASGGTVVVSGGTTEMSVRKHDSGQLRSDVSTLDFCRGLPDVVINPGGVFAYASCHFSDTVEGAMFGMTSLALPTPPAPITPLSELRIPGAGFTGGTARPANFPIESALDGSTLWVAHGAGLEGIDVADPTAIATVSRTPSTVMGMSVAVIAARAYVVGVEPAPTLQIWDVSNPAAPVEVSTMSLPADAEPRGVAVDDDWIAIAAGPAGVQIMARP